MYRKNIKVKLGSEERKMDREIENGEKCESWFFGERSDQVEFGRIIRLILGRQEDVREVFQVEIIM